MKRIEWTLYFISFQIHHILNKQCMIYTVFDEQFFAACRLVSFDSLINHTRKRSISFDLCAYFASKNLSICICHVASIDSIVRDSSIKCKCAHITLCSQHGSIHNSKQFHTFSPYGTIPTLDTVDHSFSFVLFSFLL